MIREEDLGLGAGILGVLLLGANWLWLLRHQPSFPGWRVKASWASFVCATGAGILGLLLALMIRQPSVYAVELYFQGLVVMGILSLSGVVLGFVGKGRPRLIGLGWSLIMVTACYFVFGTSGH